MTGLSRRRFTLVLVLATTNVSVVAQEAPKIDSEALGGLSARTVGPAVMSGRISAIDAHPGDRMTVWIGSASGGVWKSVNGGLTFKPVFDKYTPSIGAIAIDHAHPETVWVGTGESWVRNSVSVGTGIYKTTDGGDNWQLAGLADTEHIARVLVNPRDSNTVFVCAVGHLWNSNAERGVFRTADGGKTWNKVLFVNEDTGCSDVAIDSQNPQILYAGMWQVRRLPWTFFSGGPGSGLYRSTDGGTTWKRMTEGLPTGSLGRIAVGVAASRPSTVYAVVESKNTSLYRSEDFGEHWTVMNSSSAVQARPFYFANVVVDPKDYNRVYKLGFGLAMSDDGGKTFSSPMVGSDNLFGGSVHGDMHALWINPENANQLILGTDGGVYLSPNRGGHWGMVGVIPVSQFYHVSYDNDRPYHVYGGLQDNGTWVGPSRAPEGVASYHWRSMGIGDGFWALVDPMDSDYVYRDWQGGRLQRVRRSIGEFKDIQPAPEPGAPELRFNWNTPVHIGRGARPALYTGAQYLYRSHDRGESWERISPDLTTNDPKKEKQEESGGLTVDNSDAENHCTIFTISESPKNPNLIWVGTDDGNVQISRDAGKTWTNVVKNVSGLPANTWVSTIEAGHYAEGTAYATFDGHATGGMKTYVYRTADYGKTWQPLAADGVRGYAHVVREDVVNPNLLFLGTEFGLWISLDVGKSWAQFTGGNFPAVAVRDIAIQPRENDLLLATHGRGIYIVDDITPLRHLTPEVLNSDVAFLPTRVSVEELPEFVQRADGDGMFVAAVPPASAVIVYYLKKRHIFGDLKIEIYNAKGEMVISMPGGRRRGLNRVEMPLRIKPPKSPGGATLAEDPFAFSGPLLPEGAYTVKMVKGDQTYKSNVQIVTDPRVSYSSADRQAQYETAMKLYGMSAHLAYVVDATSELRDQARDRAGKLPTGDALRKRLESLADSLEGFRKTLVTTKEGALTGEIQLRERLLLIYGAVNGNLGHPTRSQMTRLAGVERQLKEADTKLNGFATTDVPALNPNLEKNKLQPLQPLSEADWSKRITKSPGTGGTENSVDERRLDLWGLLLR